MSGKKDQEQNDQFEDKNMYTTTRHSRPPCMHIKASQFKEQTWYKPQNIYAD
jgi:hypothetical protein